MEPKPICRVWMGRIVDIDAGGGRAGGGVDAADVDVRAFVVVVAGGTHAVALKRDARGKPCQVVDAVQALRVELLLA